ncbi:MAG: T9SS type A sorting domain-containing protein [Bacteroidota bacterium]
MNQWLRISIIVFCCLYTSVSFASTVKAVKDGEWHDDDVWDSGSAPTSADDVIIDGYEVTITDNSPNITINSLSLSNVNGPGHTELTIFGNSNNLILNINNDFNAFLGTAERKTRIKVGQKAAVNILGNAMFERSIDNNTIWRLQLHLEGDAQFNVNGHFTFDYGDSGIELLQEIYMEDESDLTIGGNTNIIQRDGANFTLEMRNQAEVHFGGNLDFTQTGGVLMSISMYDSTNMTVIGSVNHNSSKRDGYSRVKCREVSKITINGDYNIVSSAVDAFIDLTTESLEPMVIRGDITIDATSEGDVEIEIGDNSTLKFGGNLVRNSNFGSLKMDPTGNLVLDGTAPQILACTNMPGSGSDSLQYTNLQFENSSGKAVAFEGNVVVNDHMELTSSIIKTSKTTMLIIADGATISPGSSNAYVDGPVTKKGSTNGLDFVFPTGDSTTYAPIVISALSNASDEYTAQYFACPPPVEGNSMTLNAPLNSLSSVEHWSMTRASGSADVDVSLYWTDADASGIADTDNLQLAYYTASNGWFSAGGVVTLESDGGYVTNDAACPPPVEGWLTFGSSVVGGMVSLPIELISFEGYAKAEAEVWLDWVTASETDNNHFSVEKSIDGRSFHSIGLVPSKGEGNHQYTVIDDKPCPAINYYRLRQIDNDGMYSFSPTIAVDLGTRRSIVLYPNPVVDLIKVSGAALDNEPTLVEIFDNQGRLLFSRTYEAQDGNMELYTANINAAIPGTYYIKLSNDNGTMMKKFIKT